VFKSEPETVPDPESGIAEFEGDTINVNEHSPFLGIWVRPLESLRINAEVEETAADNFITRISPRQRQHYRARLNYRPKHWATVAGTADFNEARNGEIDTQFESHYRNAGLVASLFPNDRIGLDLAYNYTDAMQNSLICFNGTFIPSGTAVGGCPTFDSSENNNPNQIKFNYLNHTHYLSTALRIKPVKRVTLLVGYGLTQSDGDETILNPLQPFGPLRFTYHQPLASVGVELVRNLSANAHWNYDQYNEDSFVGPTLPRYFHDNRTALTIKYEF
jgi:hypothetical protein